MIKNDKKRTQKTRNQIYNFFFHIANFQNIQIKTNADVYSRDHCICKKQKLKNVCFNMLNIECCKINVTIDV